MEIKFEHRLTEVEERSKTNSQRLAEVEQRQDNLEDLVGTVKVLADREARVETDVQEIKTDVKSIKEQPAKKWDNFWERVLWAAVAAVLGFLFSRLGLQ